jgi:hypothetical protein
VLNLDYSNPIHSFGSVFSYTANQECYLFGSVTSGNYNPTVTINGQIYYNIAAVTGIPIMPIKLNNGDIVTVSHTMPYLHILKKNNSD